jgi:hypothetical protein
MEKRTIYIHKSKQDNTPIKKENDYRTVTFIGGNKDIITIIKELIKDRCQA